MAQFIQIEESESVTVMKIKRPEALNALNETVLNEISETVSELEKKKPGVVILTGEGKAFVAGADIAAMKTYSSAEAEKFAEKGQSVFNQIDQSSNIYIAAVNGFALGGGMELALACDIRIGSDKAKLGLPEVSLGLIPGFGGTQRMTRLIGSGRALEIILSADIISAEEGYRIGILNRLTTADELMNEAVKLAKTILSRGPVAIREAKRVSKRGLDLSLEKGLELEKKAFGALFSGNEPKEGLSAFLEKRKPNF